jgi:hypothetical protein
MKARRGGMTVRRMMAGVAIVGILLGVGIPVSSAIRRELRPTPADWARQRAASYAGFAARRGGLADDPYALDKQCEELASGFERQGETWPWREGTGNGPFTDQLTEGESVILRQEAEAIPAGPGESRRGDRKDWKVPRGIVGVVLSDCAGDADGCSPFRGIQLRFADGPREGEIASVERVYLSRKP